MSTGRLIAVTWWLQLKMRSQSAFDGLLMLVYPMFFATTIFMVFRHGNGSGQVLLSAAIGASAMGIWSAVSTTAAFIFQLERRQGTLELMVLAPRSFGLLLVPITLSMATIGLYSMAATLLWGRFAFGISLHVADPAVFVLAVLATVLAIAMLGMLLATCSVRYRAAWALGAALEMPVWLLCGFIVAVNDLPVWVRPLSWLLAPTWGMAAIRAATEGRTAWLDIGLCLLIAAAYGAVGVLIARWTVDSARKNATLALTS
jgi:ABC-2 type transport system permease protein